MSKDHDNETPPFSAPACAEMLIGQARAEAALLAAVRSRHLHHGWIFAGPPGIGKATLAWRFARFLLALDNARLHEASDLHVATDHRVFRQVAARSHPDLFIIERSADQRSGRLRREIRAEEVRAATRFFARTASAGGYRVAIVDKADEMNETAANALLKGLEEPPERGVFILVSDAPGRLLPTIRSRCRTLMLDALSPGAVADGLRLALRDDLKADTARIERAAVAGGGSIGHAARLVAGKGLEIDAEVGDLLGNLPRLDLKRAMDFAERLGGNDADEDFALFRNSLSGRMARLLRVAHEAGDDVTPGDVKLAERLSLRRNAAAWAGEWSEINNSLDRANGLNLDRRQAVLNSLLGLEKAASQMARR